MRAKLVCDIDPERILRSRGLGASNEARRALAEAVRRLADPYVPLSPEGGGHMKDRAEIASDGSSITYPGPYARFLYAGEVMVGTESGSPFARRGETKRSTGALLRYHGAPMRGRAWIERMAADRGDELPEAAKKRIWKKR